MHFTKTSRKMFAENMEKFSATLQQQIRFHTHKNIELPFWQFSSNFLRIMDLVVK